MDNHLDPIEQTYGMQIQTTVIKLLFEFKANTYPKEITVFSLAEIIAKQNPKIAHLLNDKRERQLFHTRIRKCLDALVKKGQLIKETKKTATCTNYNVYSITDKF